MRRKEGGAFAFFITSSPPQIPVPASGSMFNFGDDDAPYASLTITLFGSMTMDECKLLANMLYLKYGIKMRVPYDFDNSFFHGDTLTLSLPSLVWYLERHFGRINALPKNSVISMRSFFEYLITEVVPQKSQKNPSPSH